MRASRRFSLYLSTAVALVLTSPAAALSIQNGSQAQPQKGQSEVKEDVELLSISSLTPPGKTPITKEWALRLDKQAATTPPKMRRVGVRRADPGHGYVLVGNNKYTDYLYRSDPRSNQLFKCKDGMCHSISAVKVWFRQRVVGGKSRFWIIRFYKKRHSGTVETDTEFRINCYVSIKKKRDKSCTNWRDDNSWGVQRGQYYASGQRADDQRLRFGNTNSVRKCPIVRLTTDWWGYPGATPSHGKFRGWDTITNSRNNKLSNVTGTGY